MTRLSAITPEAPSSPLPTRKGWPLLAWLVILAAVGFILWRHAAPDRVNQERFDLLVMRLQARYLVGLSASPQSSPFGPNMRETLFAEAKNNLNRGTYAQRLRFVVLAGELKGPAEARQQLSQLQARYAPQHGDPSPEDARTAAILDRLYAQREGKLDQKASPSEEEQRFLRERLGWFGDLALNPPGEEDSAAREAVLAPAYRTAWSLLSAAGVMLGLGMLGFLALVTLMILWFLSVLRGGLRIGSPYGGVYAETFAVYMVLFLVLSYLLQHILAGLSLSHGSIALSGLAALGSLAALGWPVLRGIPWRQVCAEIGWRAGRRPLLEPFLGFACYATALPMLVVGLILVLILTKLRDRLGFGPDEFGPSEAPGHPIVFWVGRGGWVVWLEVLFVASIVAPIVEETMFRGVLYRHLREATRGLQPIWSVAVSVLLVSFLFAVIHPQGFLAVPALMALAIAFTLAREWRATLIPPMIAHGINNAVATVLLFLLTR
jgi:membrane protease YdiL (CAAX protease family)